MSFSPSLLKLEPPPHPQGGWLHTLTPGAQALCQQRSWNSPDPHTPRLLYKVLFGGKDPNFCGNWVQ